MPCTRALLQYGAVKIPYNDITYIINFCVMYLQDNGVETTKPKGAWRKKPH
jgi:hypothetical protein